MINQKNLAAGITYTVFGAAVSLASSQLPIGTAADMRAGYFPLMIGIALIAVGLLLALSALRSSPVRIDMTLQTLRPMLFACAGVVTFGLLIGPGGIILAVPAMFVFLDLTLGRFSPLRWLVMSTLMVTAAWLIFRVGLQLRVDLLPAILTTGN
ncbi:tripartite tricarboxylate transporter TctB family protein [Pelagibacterium sp.]|uniref:tripartite tricarboxylate transporter TctB family protein n=1 Tax=Pelagibacterium sp. TaxID=1967288 RepID=UPI003A8F8283